ncbi:PAS domain S-box protein [Pleomorphovibrio marinus]|uniref:PAS domain S-box protein n=1 Tax=Pleomorphovibrio marinus TaxID=2164132 RepID=UPI000E0BEA85|nr:PAS domain S-box protein [Pleomorphovibrio marinus]
METQDKIKASKVFKAVFEHTFDAVFLTDLSGNYVQSNQAACSLLGFSHDELMGLHAKNLMVMDEETSFQHYWEEFLRQGKMEGVIAMVQKDGKRRMVKFKAFAGYFPKNNLFIVSDITREVKQQEALKEIAKVQSHQVRAPLCRLMGLVQLITYHDMPEEEWSSCLDHLERTAKELDSIIRNIVEKSNCEEPKGGGGFPQ